MTLYTTFDSPAGTLGTLLLVGEESTGGQGQAVLTALAMPGQRNAPRVEPGWRRAPEAFDAAVRQLHAYFAGELTEFRLEFAARGSAFQERVWQALDTIPYGTTTTYGALAARLGVGRADVRAVGAAVGANPLLLVRPCHRVVGADGSMRGYAAGIPRKEALLTHEGVLQPQLELGL